MCKAHSRAASTASKGTKSKCLSGCPVESGCSENKELRPRVSKQTRPITSDAESPQPIVSTSSSYELFHHNNSDNWYYARDCNSQSNGMYANAVTPHIISDEDASSSESVDDYWNRRPYPYKSWSQEMYVPDTLSSVARLPEPRPTYSFYQRRKCLERGEAPEYIASDDHTAYGPSIRRETKPPVVDYNEDDFEPIAFNPSWFVPL